MASHNGDFLRYAVTVSLWKLGNMDTKASASLYVKFNFAGK